MPKLDDDNPFEPKDFSRADVIEIRKLLLAVEEGHLLHFNDPAQLEVFKRVMNTFTEHREGGIGRPAVCCPRQPARPT